MSFFTNRDDALRYRYNLTDEQLEKLKSKERTPRQEKAFLTRCRNNNFINGNPNRDFGKEITQLSHIRFNGGISRDVKVSDVVSSYDYHLNITATCQLYFKTPPNKDALKEAKQLLKLVQRKGVPLAQVCDCKLQSQRTKRSVTLPKVMMLAYLALNQVDGVFDGVFVTITFRDSYLKNTTRKQRRHDVRKWVEEQNGRAYILNIDFGKKNGREHYHLLIAGQVDLPSAANKFGRIFVEYLYGDWKHITYYETKMTNHAIKLTTQQKGDTALMVSPNLRGLTSKRQLPDDVLEYFNDDLQHDEPVAHDD